MPAGERSDRRLGLGSKAWTSVVVLVAAALLEIGPRAGLVDPFSVVPLSTMLSQAVTLVGDGSFWSQTLLPSLVAITLSFAIATVVGVGFGLLLWRFRLVRHAVDPWLTAYYAIPTFALYPLLVALLGVGLIPIVLLGALFAVVAVITATLTGLDATPPSVLRLADSLRLSARQKALKVLLPAALPQIVVGVRLALSYSLIGVLASEFVLSTRGLGHFISLAYNDFAFPNMYAGILLVLVLAAVVNAGFGFAANRWISRGVS